MFEILQKRLYTRGDNVFKCRKKPSAIAMRASRFLSRRLKCHTRNTDVLHLAVLRVTSHSASLDRKKAT